METTYVSLINRTSQTLTGRYDGKQHSLAPGSRTTWPEVIAMKFKEQNPIMGTENYHTGDKQYLLGIEEHGDPLEPVEQSDSQTLWDVAQIPVPAGYKIELIKGHGFNPIKDKQAGLPSATVGFEPNTVPMSAGPAEVITFDKP